MMFRLINDEIGLNNRIKINAMFELLNSGAQVSDDMDFLEYITDELTLENRYKVNALIDFINAQIADKKGDDVDIQAILAKFPLKPIDHQISPRNREDLNKLIDMVNSGVGGGTKPGDGTKPGELPGDDKGGDPKPKP